MDIQKITDAAELLKEAANQVAPLKAERDALWSELNKVLAEMEPMKAKEREIRAKIKKIQATLYPIEISQAAKVKK